MVRRIARWRVEQIARAPATRAAEYPRVAIASRGEWRTWLEAEHLRAHGAWVVSWKKHVGAAHVDVAAISEEALCFGWVDSLPRAFDGLTIAQLSDLLSYLGTQPGNTMGEHLARTEAYRQRYGV